MHAERDALLDALAGAALASVGSEYPFHLTHLARDDADVRAPRRLHPAFFGAYDWHSCVHMHWTLVRSLRLRPDSPLAGRIAAHLGSRLTRAAIDEECTYLDAPGRAAFERPYGWAWLLQLWSELDALAGARSDAARWRDTLSPLATRIGDRLAAWLPRADFPVRGGAHGNSAFALVLALQYAQRRRLAPLVARIGEAARRWFAQDRDYPADYEPSGDDFLSGGLCEALLMSRVLPAEDWARWRDAFLPRHDALRRWQTPVPVADPSDPKIVHLHGLNLSRAWCWRQLQSRLPEALQPIAHAATEAHRRHSLLAATDGDYVGTHWLASFALLALTGDCVDRS